MAITTRSYSADDFTFRVPIAFSGEAVDLTEASVTVLASDRTGPVIEGSISMFNGSEARGRFADGVFSPGVYRIQVRVTLGDETQTVADWNHTVSPSLVA